MADPTDAQERRIAQIMSSRLVARSEVRPLADDSREVWAFNHGGVLVTIFTVFAGGNYASRPGFRPTTDRYIGNPEDRPQDDYERLEREMAGGWA